MKRCLLVAVLLAGCEAERPGKTTQADKAKTAVKSPYEALIREWCQRHLDDPSDLEIVEISQPRTVELANTDDEIDDLINEVEKKPKVKRTPNMVTHITVRIRSKSALGGKMLRSFDYYIKDGMIVRWHKS